ncbi:MAG: DMT family transporter [Immundisolibacterales bacterium]|nr:DMT family transporter [Immundisolibacterales bacterium]
MIFPAGREPLVAVAFMVLGASLIPAMNALAKYLASDYPVWQVVWARFLGHLIWMTLFFWPRRGFAFLRTARPTTQAVRSLVFFIANVCFITALPFVDLATASAVMFTAPIIVTALAVPLLRERVGWRRWTAVAVGFAGALVIIRPASTLFDPWALLVLVSASYYAVYQIWTRRLTLVDSPETLIVYTAAAGALVTTVAFPWFARMPASVGDLAAFAALGLVGALAHLCIVQALKRAPVSTISPIGYFELVTAVLFGYAVFGELPDAATWAGAALIVASGAWIAFRGGRSARPGGRRGN